MEGVPGPWGVYLVPGGGRGMYLVPGRGCTWSQGGEGVGVPGPGGVYLVLGVYLVPGGTYPGTPPPVNKMTDRCKNITLPQTSFAGGNKLRVYNVTVIANLPCKIGSAVFTAPNLSFQINSALKWKTENLTFEKKKLLK